ncbi:MAG: hypothetical protein U9O98_05810 [Asgard group archaeon]|nr:hypothetical protein [Asgard group archaeon]
MGGMLIIELLSRKSFENLKGIILVGASRKLKTEQGLNILMKLPWFCLWPLAIMFFFFIPITFFIWWGKTWETYQEMYSFLIKDGAKKIHRQYNQTLKKLGDVNSLKNPDIPLVVIRLPKDTLVDEKDLKVTEKMFQNYREKIIPSDSIHLDEKFDPITVKLIAEEKDFLQMDCKK